MANGNAPEALSGIPQPVYQYSRQLHKALENITPKSNHAPSKRGPIITSCESFFYCLIAHQLFD